MGGRRQPLGQRRQQPGRPPHATQPRPLRNRARYETANNSYARGIVNTLANDVIGTGPRLQLLTEEIDANRRVEQEFARWIKAIAVANLRRPTFNNYGITRSMSRKGTCWNHAPTAS